MRLKQKLHQIRSGLNNAEGFEARGNCLAVSIILYSEFGFEIVRGTCGVSNHWYNKTQDGKEVDLTGDQFDRPEVQVGDSLYGQNRTMDLSDLWPRQLEKALDLAHKIGSEKTIETINLEGV